MSNVPALACACLALSWPTIAQTPPATAAPAAAPSPASATVVSNAPTKLDGAFGLRFGTPVKELVPILPVAQREPDPSSPVQPPLPDPLFDRDRYQIHITRETGLVWSIEATTAPIPYDDEPRLEAKAAEITASLTARHGEPFRDYTLGLTVPHQVWRTDTGAIILHAAGGEVQVSYQDDRMAGEARQETLAALKAGFPKRRRFGPRPPPSSAPPAASPLPAPATVTGSALPNPLPQLDGAWGVRFGSHFRTLHLGGEPTRDDPSPSLDFVPPQPDPLLDPTGYFVSFTPQAGLVWRLEAYVGPFADAAAREARITQATAALTAQYGPPFRDHSVHAPASHLVWRVGGNAVILDAMAALGEEIILDGAKPSRYITVSYQNGPLAEQAHREAVAARQAKPDPFRNLPKVVPLK